MQPHTHGRFRPKAALGALVFFSLIFFSCRSTSGSSGGNGKNLIIIVADDLGWKDLSCYGNTDIHTPHIDSLAERGVRFTNAFVTSSSSAPSRGTLITGQYPHTNGLDSLAHIRPGKSLSAFRETLPEVVKKQGYRTATAGKWHVAPFSPVGWFGYHEALNGRTPAAMHIDDMTPVKTFLQENREGPFYLEINYMNNHRHGDGSFDMDPRHPVDPAEISVPEYYALPESPGLLDDLAKYYSQTLRMDEMIGEVLAELDSLGLAEDTVILFFSDNGPPYPGSKMTLYDRGTGTPLIIAGPSIPAGKTVNDLVCSVDFAPTLLDILGLQGLEDAQGCSFLPWITGAPDKPFRDAVYLEMTYHVDYIPTRAVRTREWKYIRNYSASPIGLDQLNHVGWARDIAVLDNQPWTRPRVREELYNLLDDPDEQHNLIGTEPETATRMRALLDQHMLVTDDAYLEKGFKDDYKPEHYAYRPYKKPWWERLPGKKADKEAE